MNNTSKFEIIADEVCTFSKLDRSLLFIKSRKTSVVGQRQIFHYISKLITSAPLSEIGKFDDLNYDHVTVRNSCIQVSNRIQTEPAYSATLVDLIQIINDKINEEIEIERSKQPPVEFFIMQNKAFEMVLNCRTLDELNNILKLKFI
jgi:hypothetical protein